MKVVRFVFASALTLALAGPVMADTAESLLARSRSAERAGKFDMATRFAQGAIVADPKNISPYLALADIYMHAGHPDFAGFYYAEALQLDPQSKLAQDGLATADRAANETKKRTTAADRSLDKKNTDH